MCVALEIALVCLNKCQFVHNVLRLITCGHFPNVLIAYLFALKQKYCRFVGPVGYYAMILLVRPTLDQSGQYVAP